MKAIKSLLFVPGNKEDMIRKAFTLEASAVVIDLEDAVSGAEKSLARSTVYDALSNLEKNTDAKPLVALRINPSESNEFQDDLKLISEIRLDLVVLPKYERKSDIERLHPLLATKKIELLVGIETARGVANCFDILDQGIIGAYFGAEDYIADLGGRRTKLSTETLFARSQVALAGRVCGIQTIDQAVVAVRDSEHYQFDADSGRDIGYTGKICLHPLQVTIANSVFAPSQEEILLAREILAMEHQGVGTLNGEMIDAVHVKMAKDLISKIQPSQSN